MSLSRRSFIKSLPVAGFAVGAGVGISNAAELEQIHTDNPAMVNAIAAFDAALGAYQSGLDAKRDAIAVFKTIKPAAVPELRAVDFCTLADGYTGAYRLAERDQDAELNDLFEGNRPRYRARSWRLREEATRFDGRSSLAKRLKRLAADAERYEAAWEDAQQNAGVPEAIQEMHYLWSDLSRALHNLCALPATCPFDVVAKAQARTAAIGLVPDMVNISLDARIIEDVSRVMGVPS